VIFFWAAEANIVRDPPLHDEIRAKMARPLLPQSLKTIREQVQVCRRGSDRNAS